MTWGTTHFEPGGSIGLVSRETVALIVSGEPAVRDTLWSLVATDAPLDEVLEGLSGHGLRNLPSFAIVRIEGDRLVRVVVRGTALVRLSTSNGEVLVESRSAKTWVEREIDDVDMIELASIEPGGMPGLEGSGIAEEAPFHVLAGSVPAARLRRSLIEADQHSSVADEGWSTVDHVVADQPDDNGHVVNPTNDEADRDVEPGLVDQVEETPEPDVLGSDEAESEAEPAAEPAAESESEPEPERVVDDELELLVAGSPLPPPVVAPEAASVGTSFDSGATLLPSDMENLQWAALADGSPISVTDAELAAPQPDVVAPAGPAPEDGAHDGYDYLFGHTVARSVHQAAVQPPVDVQEPTPGTLIDAIPGGGSGPESTPTLGDHDGHTISRADLAKLRGGDGGMGAGASPPVVGPTVQARMCTANHPNPTHLTVCRTCGGPMSSNPPVAVARPVLGMLRFSNGLVVHLDRPQLIGRSPKVEGHVGGEIPNLVRLEEAGQGVSRRHVAVHLENWQVLLEDLNSANGTIVALPGRPARRLVAGEPVSLEPGTVIDLGGEMSISFEAVR